jgi:hypothetical protein
MLELQEELQLYYAEFTASKGKVWPNLTNATDAALKTGGVSAVALALIPGPRSILPCGLVGGAIGALASALDGKVDRLKLQMSAPAPVAYLSL